VVVLHTVLTKPRAEERRITHDLADRATVLVVPSHSARILLEDEYGIPAEQVTVIPHGSAWQPAPPTGSANRRRILTWGLLGPGKGIERAIAAIAQLKDLDPAPIYTVVGQTHPQVARREGFTYRDRLHEMVDDLGLVGQVEFDDGYKSDDDLYRLVAASDVIVVPYDNCEQVCSGVLTEAVSVGRPVVATSFPHARELLGSGAGMVIDHDDLSAFSAAIRTFLTDDVAYRRAVEMARRQALNLSWSNVAGRYQALLDRLTSTLAVG
jgi:glycosyltransferase involved in cell wall biosynthesis